MNSLNLLSAKVIGQPITRPRTKPQGQDLQRKASEELSRGRSHAPDNTPPTIKREDTPDSDTPVVQAGEGSDTPQHEAEEDEKQLLLRHGRKESTSFGSRLQSIIKKIADALSSLLAVIGTPVIYVATFLQDESGHYSTLSVFRRKRRKEENKSLTTSTGDGISEKAHNRVLNETRLKHSYSSDSLSSMNSDSDSDRKRGKDRKSKKAHLGPEEHTHKRRSSRIRLLQNDDVTQRQKSRLADNATAQTSAPLTVDNIKAPISTSSANKLRYPRTHHPPRPLIPRRQPSYSHLSALSSSHAHRRQSLGSSLHQKTLILDLDETLIHSIAKGSRMSSGHMVEVKLNTPVLNPVTQAGPGGSPPQPQVVAPYHPILYYVHKRPHCDDFLRKVCKWYKVVIFTASVQEYADPVIDWLEQERKYFSGRYYRPHCTFRSGSYIKDLSSIEPDLSKVIILDNSPVSYVFHEDNAIPIEGWINDPTDNDLLHLIPLLEALQYVTDVRALLALRRGEADASATTSAPA